MAKHEKKKLREKNTEDLIKEVVLEAKKLQELRFDLVRGKVKNSALVRDSRRNIALLKTLINEKQRGANGTGNYGEK